MRAKYLLLDFISFAFYLGLISFCIVFFIQGNNFKIFGEIIKSLTPIAFLITLLFIKSKFDRRELKKRTSEANLEIILHLNFFDKIISDIVWFLLPIIILLVAFMAGKTDTVDLLQALIAFIIFYLWQKHLFNQDYQ